jgi:hypothetical protein
MLTIDEQRRQLELRACKIWKQYGVWFYEWPQFHASGGGFALVEQCVTAAARVWREKASA